MRALVYTAPRRVDMEDCPRPHPAVGEVEIAVAAAGICGADISGFLGRSRRRTPPLILGHELVGHTPDGRRVVADPLVGCGRLRGMPRAAQGISVPACACWAWTDGRLLCRVCRRSPSRRSTRFPMTLTDARAIFAEPLANIVHLFRLAAPPPLFPHGHCGRGRHGFAGPQDGAAPGSARGAGRGCGRGAAGGGQADGRHAGGKSQSRTRRGAQLCRSWPGPGAGCVRREPARQAAFDLCRPGGTVVLLGMAEERSEIDFGASIRKEHRVLMSFGYTPAGLQAFARAACSR